MERRLRVADLEPGQVGVLEAVVQGVAPVRPYPRKRGGEGLVGRVTLSDGSGEVELVLWDDETRLLRGETWKVGAALRLRGATVRVGYRGGIELGLGAAVVEPIAGTQSPEDDPPLEGRLVMLGPTRVIDDQVPVRFQADIVLATATGEARFVAWDDLVRELQGLELGAAVAIEGVRPHPLIPGHFVATSESRLRPPE